MTPPPKSQSHLACHALWIAGLLVPLAAVVLWDRLPRYQAVRELRDSGIQVAPLSVHKAIHHEDLSTLELLHAAQVPLDEISQSGATPLIESIRLDHSPITRYLASRPEVNCDQVDESGLSPLAHAIMLHQFDAIEALLPRVSDPNVPIPDGQGNTLHPLFKAIQERNGTLLRLLLTHPQIDLNVRDDRERTPLHHAVAQEDPLIARALLSGYRQPDLDVPCADGHTPLAVAVRAKRAEAVALLLGAGAKRSTSETTAFAVTAIDHADPRTLHHLLAHGADPNVLHPGKATPILHHAMDLSALGSVHELLQAGAETEGALKRAIRCGQGMVAHVVAENLRLQGEEWIDEEGLLNDALASGNAACMDLLLENGTDPNQFEPEGQRLLVMALARKKPDVVRRLLELGADPNLRLEQPVSSGFRELFAEDAKTAYYLRHDRQLSPLMLAALMEEEQSVRYLLAHGASTRAFSSRYKRYPVAFAAERHNVPIMQMILGRQPNDESRKIIVSLKDQKAVLYKNGQVANTSKVSTGKRGYRTDRGTFVITNKHRHHRSSIYGSSMPFFMRLSCDDFGFHYSSSVPSYPASHGCIRMPWTKAKEFFASMEVGDVVVIQ